MTIFEQIFTTVGEACSRLGIFESIIVILALLIADIAAFGMIICMSLPDGKK